MQETTDRATGSGAVWYDRKRLRKPGTAASFFLSFSPALSAVRKARCSAQQKSDLSMTHHLPASAELQYLQIVTEPSERMRNRYSAATAGRTLVFGAHSFCAAEAIRK